MANTGAKRMERAASLNGGRRSEITAIERLDGLAPAPEQDNQENVITNYCSRRPFNSDRASRKRTALRSSHRMRRSN